MIYKLDIDDLDDIDLDSLKEFFCFFLIDGTLFLSLKTIQDEEKKAKVLKEMIKSLECELIEINRDNLKYEAPVIQDWCRDNFVRLETQLYERDEQERLLEIWKNLDKMEEILQSKKKGGK